MTETCECYKKLKYLEYCYNLENAQETQQVEENLEHRTSILSQREKAVRLPGVIRVNDSVLDYPDTMNSELPHLFSEMAQIITGVDDFEFNILSFWILDVFLEGLRTAQLSGMSQRNQKATLHWIAYVFNVMQGSGSKLTRRDLFLKIKLHLLTPPDDDDDDDNDDNFESQTNVEYDRRQSLDQNSIKQWQVPFPPVWRVDNNKSLGETQSEETDTRTTEEYEMSDQEQNLHDTETLLEIIYHIYARLWSFFLIRTSLRSTPYLEVVDLPFKLNVPKRLLKYDNGTQTKSGNDKGGRKTAPVKAPEEIPPAKEGARNEYILPLQAAKGMETFLRQLFALPSHESIFSEKDKVKQDKKKK